MNANKEELTTDSSCLRCTAPSQGKPRIEKVKSRLTGVSELIPTSIHTQITTRFGSRRRSVLPRQARFATRFARLNPESAYCRDILDRIR